MLNTEDTYLSDIELKRMIKKNKTWSIVEENKSYIKITDRLGIYQNRMTFNKSTFKITDSLVESFGLSTNELEIVKLLQELPRVLFMNINKVYIVDCEEHVELLYSLSPNHSFDLMQRGLYVCEDGNIIISLSKHVDMADELVKKRTAYGDVYDYEVILKDLIWRTITELLIMSFQRNPLYEDKVEQGDEAVVQTIKELFGELPIKAI